MKNRFIAGMLGTVLLTFSVSGIPQTAQQKVADAAKEIPLMADGKPDLSGIWVPSDSGSTRVDRLELTPWGLEKFTWNAEPSAVASPESSAGRARPELDPINHCYPPGLVRLGPPIETAGGARAGEAVQIVQTPGRVILVYEQRNSFRHIYTDGREHPKLLELTWNGHSIGKWEGDTFVVDTIGLRDETWLDSAGHEHSDQLHVVERFRRTASDTLDLDRTLRDPVALAKPYNIRVVLKLEPDHTLDENGNVNDCSQYMVRKPVFGEGIGGLLGISDHP